jgi:hypothetical protein
MSFEIHIHADTRIIEVIYPARPSAADVADYLHRIQGVIREQKSSWRCLVDQRALQLISPELVEHIAATNSYAAKHGMERSARLVNGAVASLQASRLARQADLADKVRTFHDRAEALAWLTS